MKLTWKQPLGLAPNRYYLKRLVPAVNAGLGYIASAMERHAKQTAPWTDRTGAARRGLHGYTERVGPTTWAAVLSHGKLVPYGASLEERSSTAVIEPTLRSFGPQTFPAIKRFLLLK